MKGTKALKVNTILKTSIAFLTMKSRLTSNLICCRWSAGYYATALMYVFYGIFTLTGFFVWWRTRNREMARVEVETNFPDPTVNTVEASHER